MYMDNSVLNAFALQGLGGSDVCNFASLPEGFPTEVVTHKYNGGFHGENLSKFMIGI